MSLSSVKLGGVGNLFEPSTQPPAKTVLSFVEDELRRAACERVLTPLHLLLSGVAVQVLWLSDRG